MTGIHSSAEKLLTAWEISKPLRASDQSLNWNDAAIGRAVQAELDLLMTAAGRRRVGWKVGLTSPAALAAFGADEPMVGVIYEDSVLRSGATLHMSRCCSPRIEGEILLEIGTPPIAGADDISLLASIASVRGAFEIADSRIDGWPRQIGRAIADNACCGFVVPGIVLLDPASTDFSSVAMKLTSGSETLSEGTGSASMGSVLQLYRWFVETSAIGGRDIRKGDIILTGALGPAISMAAQKNYTLHIDGFETATLKTDGNA